MARKFPKLWKADVKAAIPNATASLLGQNGLAQNTSNKKIHALVNVLSSPSTLTDWWRGLSSCPDGIQKDVFVLYFNPQSFIEGTHENTANIIIEDWFSTPSIVRRGGANFARRITKHLERGWESNPRPVTNVGLSKAYGERKICQNLPDEGPSSSTRVRAATLIPENWDGLLDI